MSVTTLAITAGTAPAVSVPARTAVTLTATVTSGGVALSPGRVDFCDAVAVYCTGSHFLGTAQLTSAGVATWKFVPGPGTHSYKAVFAGTNTFAGSASQPAALTVVSPGGPVLTTVGIQASGGQGNYGLLGTVAPAGMVSPTGQATFLDTTNTNYPLGVATLTPTGAGNPSFRTAYSLQFPLGKGLYPGIVATGDFDNDGHPDVLFASTELGAIYTLLGNGDGTFRTLSFAANVLTLPYEPPVVTDFNGDGKLDFVVRSFHGLAVYLGNGDGTFTAGPTFAIDPLAFFTAADFDGDGIPDLLVEFKNNLYTYRGDGKGGFATPKLAFQTVGNAIFSLLADFNRDGAIDVFQASASGDGQLLLGNGDGTFRKTNPYPGRSLGVGVDAGTVGDVNDDGIPDVLVAQDFAQRPPHVLLGNGDGTFTILPGDSRLTSASRAVALADVNGDGISDVVLPYSFGGDTNVYIGRGDGTFTPDIYSPGLTSLESQSLATADFNGDGQADIAQVFHGDYNQFVVFLSQSASTAAGYARNISPVGTGYHDVEAFYPGDANNPAGTSQTISLLAERVQTNLSLAVLPAGGSLQGQAVTLTANLDRFFAQNHHASGTVTFSSNGTPVGTAQIANGTASLTTSALTAGTDDLQAEYGGDTNFQDAASAPSRYTVTPQQAQTIAFPQPASPAYAGTSVYLTAASSSGLPVSYRVVSGPATVSGSIATYTGVGTVVLEASQAGGSGYQAAAPVQQSVSASLLTEPVGVSSGPVLTAVTFTATGTLGSVGFLTRGAANLDFGPAQAAPGNAALPPCAVGTTYLAGQSCYASFAFTPTVPGARYGGIALTSGAGAVLANSPVYGVGVGPQVHYLPGRKTALNGGFLTSAGLAVDGAGNLFLADVHNDAVKEFTAASGYTSIVTVASLVSPTDVAVDGSGNLFVAQNNTVGQVTELFAAGGYTTSSVVIGGLKAPGGIAVDGNGNLFVTDYTADTVSEYLAASGYGTVIRLGGSYSYPVGIAVDAGGNAFIADFGTSKLTKVSASSGYTSAVQLPGLYSFARSVAVNPSGDLFVGSQSGFERVFAAGGYGRRATLDANLSVAGAALDDNGNVFYSDFAGHTVDALNYATPPTLTFAATPVGTTSGDSPQTVTQIDNGTADLLFSAPQAGTNPSITSGFVLGSSSTCPLLAPGSAGASLAVGASCTYSVSFVPVAAGPAFGKLVTADNLGTQTILLNGTGTALSPTLTFSVANHIFGDPPFVVAASSNSPGAIAYSVVSGPATIAGATVTLTGIGSVTLLASQAASGIYGAASQTATFTVSAATPQIAFTVPNHTFGDPPFAVSAISNSAGAFTYSVVSGPATISGATVTLIGTGTVTLQASQAANGNYAAGSQTANFQVGPQAPTIVFTVPNHASSDAPFAVAATSNSAGAFTYSVVSGPATVAGSTVTLTGAGTVTLLASQAANGNFSAGSQTASFSVTLSTPALVFSVPNHVFGDPPFVVVASSNSSGTIAYSVVSGPATIAGSTVTLTGAGTVTLQANQAATGIYGAASQTATFAVSKASQTIAFAAPASPVNFGGAPVALTASASSGLPVVFSVLSGPATVSGSVLTVTGTGTVVVAADQPGNANYAAAPQVTRAIVVIGRLAGISLTATPNPVFLQNPLTLTVNLTATGGVPGGTVVFLDGANALGTAAVNGAMATLVSSSLGVGVHSITAAYSGDGVFAPVSSAAVLVTVQDFSLSAANPSVTIDHGGTATYHLMLSWIGGAGLASTIQFSLVGAPDHSEIDFSPQSVASGSGATPVTLVIHTPNYPVGPFSSLAWPKSVAAGSIAFACLLLPLGMRRFRMARGMAGLRWIALLVLGLAGLGALQGCGSGWKTQEWTMQVTAASGNLSRTATLTLTSKCSDGQPACPVR